MQVQSPNSICTCNLQQVSRFIHISGEVPRNRYIYIYIYMQRFPGLVAHLFMQNLLRSLGGLGAQLTTGGILLNEECKAGGRKAKRKRRREGESVGGRESKQQCISSSRTECGIEKYVVRLIGRDKVYQNGERSKPYES